MILGLMAASGGVVAMTAKVVRVEKIVEQDGEVHVQGLPYKRGQMVEVMIRSVVGAPTRKGRLTARKLLDSGLPGLWADRQDIADSSGYARYLREQAQLRTKDRERC